MTFAGTSASGQDAPEADLRRTRIEASASDPTRSLAALPLRAAVAHHSAPRRSQDQVEGRESPTRLDVLVTVTAAASGQAAIAVHGAGPRRARRWVECCPDEGTLLF